MPLCGSSFCGCAVVSVPADFAEISGAFPTIDVAGNGTSASPWNLTLNDEWANKLVDQSERMSCLVSRTAAQLIPTGVTTVMLWNAVDSHDTHDLHNPSVNPSRITVPMGGGGLWMFGHQIGWEAGTGNRAQLVRINGAFSPFLAYTDTHVGTSTFAALSSSQVCRLSDGDYIESLVSQNTGANLAVRGDASAGLLSNFWAARLGD